MVLHFNVTGQERKSLVKVIEKSLGVKSVYRFMPTCAYEIGDYTVEKDGSLVWDDEAGADPERINRTNELLKACAEAGFRPEKRIIGESGTGTEEAIERKDAGNADQKTGLTISLPRDGIDEETVKKLRSLVDAKANLIRKALSASSLEITTDGARIMFPWFAETPEAEMIQASTAFIAALVDMARNAKRVTATERPVENEKYAFRCFLLRLGFIGEEYKDKRRVLLKNLSGSSAFRNGRGKGSESE